MDRIGLQLYSVRDELSKDFEGTLARLVDFGYRSFETAGMFGKSVAWFADWLKAHHCAVSSMHTGLPKTADVAGLVETATALGTKTVVVPWMSPENFRNAAGIRRAADDLMAAHDLLAPHGLSVIYHNHDFEWRRNEDGHIPHEDFQKLLPKAIGFEIDAYWAYAAGQDPFAIAQKLKKRARYFHIKDGFGTGAMVALGKGKVGYHGRMKAFNHVEHLIVELDESRGNMMDDVRDSYKFLKAEISSLSPAEELKIDRP